MSIVNFSRKKLLLIFNPRAGQQKFPALLFDVVDKFTAAGFLVTVYPTQMPGDVNNFITRHARAYDCLVCSGGDGTIGEAVNALMTLNKHPLFGLIPSGTVNDFALSLGISKDMLSAAGAVIHGKPKPLDIGRFGNKYFSYVAAFGLFTDVSYSTPQNSKNIFGNIAYFLEGVKRLGSIRARKCKFTLDGETISGEFILGMVANTHSVGGFKLPEQIGARMDDGFFDVILLQMPKDLRDTQNIIAYLSGQKIQTELLTVRKARKISFSSDEETAWTLDGDFGGQYREVEIENRHHAVNIMIEN